jgi:hypothetical protein
MGETRTKVEDLAAELLGVDDFRFLCRSVLDRCTLPHHRFEAGEFGRNQHSSASAGAILNGVGSLPCIERPARQELVRSIFGLIRPDGTLLGHDHQGNVGTTSWSLGQILAGLSRFGGPDIRSSASFRAAVIRLLGCQDKTDGSWLLREEDLKDPVFAFYPALLLMSLRHDDFWSSAANAILSRTRAYLMAILRQNSTLTDQVLAAYIIDRIDSIPTSACHKPDDARHLRTSLLNTLLSDSGSRMEDRIVQNDVQPRWHAVIWTAPLYLCTRQWGMVTSPYNVMLGKRLISQFDRKNLAWHGPHGHSGPGTSWATSLGLRAAYLLADDLCSQGLDSPDWTRLVNEVSMGRKFDVVISFGGPDRSVAEAIRDGLVEAGLSVFYDNDFQHQLLGEDLAILLQDIYFARSRYAVTVLSRAFVESEWAGNWEWRAVLARMNKQREGYLLPYFLERIEIPGLNPTIGYLSAEKYTPADFAKIVARKIRGS